MGAIERIDSLRNQGRAPADPWLRHREVGFNFRMDELSAALGVAQVRRIDEILRRRSEVVAAYDRALGGVDGLRLPLTAPWAQPAWFVYFIQVDSRPRRDALVEWLRANGVEAKEYFDPPIHQQPPYAGARLGSALPATEEAAARTLIVPLFAAMRPDQVETVAQALTEGLGALSFEAAGRAIHSL